MELLTAVAILLIIAVMIAMIFSDSDRIWFFGTGRAVNSLNGRAAMNLLSHDLEHAVADNVFTFCARPDRYSAACYGFTNDEICFVTLVNDSSDSNRTAREVHYYYTTNKSPAALGTLMRGYFSGEIVSASNKHCYYNRSWYETNPIGAGRPTASQVIAENVAAFSVFCPFPGSDMPLEPCYSDAKKSPPPLWNDQLPPYVDVYMEILNDLQASQVTNLPTADRRPFVERNATRYATRVYFQNKYGYRVW